MEAVECGAASLAMILAYYGRWVPLDKMRIDCGVSRDGSKASNVLRTARSYGLEAKGMTYSTEALMNKGSMPCILFWNFCHFVVLTGFSRNRRYAYINDPSRGRVKVSIDQFEDAFTGVVLEFKPTDSFEPGGQKPDPFSFIIKRLSGLWGAVGFVMATSAIVALVGVISTSLARVFLDNIITAGNKEWLPAVVALLVALALVSLIASVLNAYYLMRIQGKVAVVSSSRFMEHLLRLPIGFYSQRMSGDLLQRQQANETIAYALVGQLAPIVANGAMLILYLVVMLRYSIPLTLVGVATVVLNAVVARKVSDMRVNVSRSMAMDSGKLYASTVSGIGMIETIKAAGAERGYFERWAGYQANVNEADVRMAYINERLGSVPQAVTQFANIAVLVLGVYLIEAKSFTPGALLSFQGFMYAFMSPVVQIVQLGQTVQETQTQMERVEDVLMYPTDVPEDPFEGGKVGADGHEFPDKLSGLVEVKNLTFGYSPLEPPLLEDLSIRVEPGQWIALVGPSGCGKSTISKLVCGLYKPWSGQVCFDGTPAQDIPIPVLRGSLAVVDQDIVTFDDSVSNNIKLWDDSIEDFEVILAARDAGIHDLIAGREGGYNGPILPGGKNFSGGQLQRLEIARVLAQDPSVIILDEATSALDAQTEAEVIQHIRDRGISCIVVAHRLSTIRDCDEIIVLDNGKVVERGTHDSLMARDGAYANLVRND